MYFVYHFLCVLHTVFILCFIICSSVHFARLCDMEVQGSDVIVIILYSLESASGIRSAREPLQSPVHLRVSSFVIQLPAELFKQDV